MCRESADSPVRKAGDVRSEASASGLGRAASAPLSLKPARLPSPLDGSRAARRRVSQPLRRPGSSATCPCSVAAAEMET